MVQMILLGKSFNSSTGLMELNFGTAIVTTTDNHVFLVGGKPVMAKNISVGSTVFM